MSAASEMVAALLAAGDPHTFRVGSVLATVGGFYANENVFTVERVEATFDGTPVIVDAPYLYVDAPVLDDPLASAHLHIADTIRTNMGA
jgi:hypothetical protein